MEYTFHEISRLLQGRILSSPFPGDGISRLLFDSRRVFDVSGSVFFAIETSRNDGHLFLEELLNRGVRNFIVEKEDISDKILDSANVLAVDNSVKALQELASFHRRQFKIPVLAITGSNGKTIVKEWLSQVLSSEMPVCYSPNSYNSRIGVPLSVWQLNHQHRMGIFEAGISMPGEMLPLEKVIGPTAGIFTNIGQAHGENFASLDSKADEKAQLFRNTEFLIYCRDHQAVHDAVCRAGIEDRAFTWGADSRSSIRLLSRTRKSSRTLISFGDGEMLELPFTDHASVENAMHCFAFLKKTGWETRKIQKALSDLKALPGRLEMMEGIHRCTLINDSYSSDLNSLEVALEFLDRQAMGRKKTVILSDILQSGIPGDVLYPGVVSMLVAHNINRVIGIGSSISMYAGYFPMAKDFFYSTRQFIEDFPFAAFQDEILLLKGARRYGFEEIARVLQHRAHETVLEINLPSIAHNLGVFKSYLPRQVKVMAMVKAFSYGSGTHEVAWLLQHQGIDCLAVAYPDEGVALRRAGITAPIVVMNPENHSWELLVHYNLEPEIYSQRILEAYAGYIKSHPDGNPVPAIHVKLDSGMHRLGFLQEDLPKALACLKEHTNIRVRSVFSHLAGSEDPSLDPFTHRQAEVFEEMAAEVSDSLQYPVQRHLLNTAGITRFPQYHYEMVRLGLGLYGLAHDPWVQSKLQPVGRLLSVISQIKTIPAGETVGYNCRWKAESDTRIGIVPVGYADGLRRELGQKGLALWVNGQPAPVVGSVSMDMCAVNLNGVTAAEGDPVVVFDSPEDIRIFARQLNTIPYEIISGISQRVKRVYLMG